MGWNYRVFKTKDGEYNHYSIREVYYKDNNDDDPQGYTSNPIKPEVFDEIDNVDQIKNLRWQLENMIRALDKPILTEEDFKSEDEQIKTNQPDWDWDITYWAYSYEYVYDRHKNKRLISDVRAELEERTERINSEMLKDE